MLSIYLLSKAANRFPVRPVMIEKRSYLFRTSWINLGQIYDLPRSDQLVSLLRMYDMSKITADQDNGQFSDGSKHRRIIIFSLTQKSIIQCHTALSEEQEEERI